MPGSHRENINNQLRKKISEEFANGNFEFSEVYLADDINWNILSESSVIGKNQVLEVSNKCLKYLKCCNLKVSLLFQLRT